jgi:Xaa-Pro aminopeptidase
VYERPIIAPGWDVELREDMTFCFETPYYELGWGGMMVEDTVVITADGCRLLNVSDRSLRSL